jgi:hypothetical protein
MGNPRRRIAHLRTVPSICQTGVGVAGGSQVTPGCSRIILAPTPGTASLGGEGHLSNGCDTLWRDDYLNPILKSCFPIDSGGDNIRRFQPPSLWEPNMARPSTCPDTPTLNGVGRIRRALRLPTVAGDGHGHDVEGDQRRQDQ